MPNNTKVVPFDGTLTLQGSDTSELHDGPVQQNFGWRGVRLVLNITSVLGSSPTLNIKLQSKVAGADNTWIDLPGASFAEKTGTGTDDLIVYPGVAETANRSVSDVISGVWRAVATVGGTAGNVTDKATLTSDTTAPSDGGTVTLGARVYTYKTALTEVYASSALVGDGTNAANNSIITINEDVYTYKTTLTEAKGTSTFTLDDVMQDGETITLGVFPYVFTYTFKTVLTGAQFEVLIGAAAADSLDNLKLAVNNTGTPGTEHGPVMAHPQIEATTNSDTQQVFSARAVGFAGNAYQSTETTENGSFAATRFAGGKDSIANEVKIGADDDGSLANLADAINGEASTRGTAYATATVASTVVSASVSTNTLTATALELGVVPNDYPTLASTSPDSHQDWADTTLGGGTGASTPGVDAVADEVLIGATAATALDNIKSAVNGTAGEGTTYSTGTDAHELVLASTNTDTTQLFETRSGVSHTVGDALASTTTEAHLSFGATTFAGGVDAASFTFTLGGNYLE